MPRTIGAVVIVADYSFVNSGPFKDGHLFALAEVVVEVIADLAPLVVGDAQQPAIIVIEIGIGDILVGGCPELAVGIVGIILECPVGKRFVGYLSPVVVAVGDKERSRYGRCGVVFLLELAVVVIGVMNPFADGVGFKFEPAECVIAVIGVRLACKRGIFSELGVKYPCQPVYA